MLDRLKFFLNPFCDGRYEDMNRGWKKVVPRDFIAGSIVAMLAIPMNMGFAIASGLHPVHGLIAGAFACLLGALFGGSKYQVYGPTAAYIPVLAAVMTQYGGGSTDPLSPEYVAGYNFLIICSVLGGVILIVMGLTGLGAFINKVPHSIVVGFTIGIALTIAFTQIGDVMGLKAKIPSDFLQKFGALWNNIGEFNIYALLIAAATFLLCKYLLQYSVYTPGPVIAVAFGIILNETVLSDQGLTASINKYGPIPTSNFFKFTPPTMPEMTSEILFGLVYFTAAVVFVAAIESLLCSNMGDRLAENKGTPYNPDKELFGQGMVNTFVPLLNGFTCTGALARTATNIKVGGTTPLAGILNCFLKISMVYFLASHLDQVPMACIGGILAYVAFNMVKRQEIEAILRMNRFHIFLMVYTAAAVFVKDFLFGVLTGLIFYVLLRRFFDRPRETATA